MNRQPTLTLRRGSALAMVLTLAFSVLFAAPLARAQESVRLTEAEFRWGISKQSAGPSHEPKRFNFLSAGDLTGASWPIRQAGWRSADGNVRIEKRDNRGETAVATWAGVTSDQSGAPLSGDAHSGLEAVFHGGEGSVDAEAGTAQIDWDGTVSILYYDGRTRLTVSDPELKVTPSAATVTATLGGVRSDRDSADTSPMTPRRVVLATLPRDCVELGGEDGFAVSPEYLGVKYSNSAAPQYVEGANWGAFPKPFVDFAVEAGSGQFWYSTGAEKDDQKKVPLPISIGYSDGASYSITEVCETPSSGGSQGLVGQVVDDTIEDILRAAGTDVADTAAAWMDEAWKPVQPDAVTAARAGGASGAPVDGDMAGAADADYALDPEMVEYFAAGSPVTAGTVGAALASVPAADSSTAAASGPVPSQATLTDQGTVPVAANAPLYGADVVYAQTSASQEAGNPIHQWQWWMGAALLALAAVLFYQTVRRKD